MGVSIEKSNKNSSLDNSDVVSSEKSEALETNNSVQYNKCYNCQDKISSRERVFSEQSWEVLLKWNEINPSTVKKPICDYCYQELRSILMERNDEANEIES